jgi:hypothetical protein
MDQPPEVVVVVGTDVVVVDDCVDTVHFVATEQR